MRLPRWWLEYLNGRTVHARANSSVTVCGLPLAGAGSDWTAELRWSNCYECRHAEKLALVRAVHSA